MNTRTLVVALLVLTVVGPVATIAASTGDEVDPLVLRPGTGDGAAYASVQGGELTIRVNSTLGGPGSPDGVNARATTRIDGAFTIENAGEDPCDTWITDRTDDVTPYHSPSGSVIEGSTNAVRIAPGGRISVGLDISPNATPATDLMDEITIRCRTVTGTPPGSPGGGGRPLVGSGGGPSSPTGPSDESPGDPDPGTVPVEIDVIGGAESSDGGRVVTAGDRATLTASTDGAVDSFEWTVTGPGGGRMTDRGQSMSHRFGRAGYYTANLTVTDDEGAIGRAQVRVLANDRPLVELLAEEPISTGRSTELYADVTNEYGATNVTWRFADGTIVHGQRIRRTFADSGTKPVEITVRDEYGASSTIDRQLTVSADPPDPLPGDGGTDDLAVIAGFSLVAVGALNFGRRRRGRRRRR